ncbi:L-histidine N(alpha)-methyltransferase [Burkholderia glumae]|uniref:L-histidine N(alpha)-methyltransferase n=1 Tax=Burkholderia glumae TaxID=337 RepID=UPI000C271E3B|nr:L-histidine N(alpha)-methyltransferase [Burkholderia glumae AU6208]QHE13588.1 L-histidine N(alpha)-methyltransferase [Burkholderia glumae AU6208]
MYETSDLFRPDAGAAARARKPSPFGRDLIEGLSTTPRSISPKYFYDAAGSALFDRICELPEYYPTRTEHAILERHAADIAAAFGAGANLIEFGAGSLSKIRFVLDACIASVPPASYVPVDISAAHLRQSAETLRRQYPGLDVQPVAADYLQAESMRELARVPARRVGIFFGSTIGNFSNEEAETFLSRSAALLAGGGMLIGVDLVKDEAILNAAYNDSAGVTAAFNLNLLARANAELGADFELEHWAHRAFYDSRLQRIEMHLVSRREQTVHVGGRGFRFAEGETLHTENSRKFTIDGFRELATRAGFVPAAVWTDEARLFSLHWLASPAR